MAVYFKQDSSLMMGDTLGSVIKRMDSLIELDKQQIMYLNKEVISDIVMMSWRGDYTQLGIAFSLKRFEKIRDSILTAERFLGELRSCINQYFVGYKGGNYKMDEDTPIHIDNYGECKSEDIGLQIQRIYKYEDGINIQMNLELDLDKTQEKL